MKPCSRHGLGHLFAWAWRPAQMVTAGAPAKGASLKAGATGQHAQRQSVHRRPPDMRGRWDLQALSGVQKSSR